MNRNPVEELILEEIRKHGPITFARFMELALYAPGLGYYERSTAQIGREGDFYTSVSVGPLFGELLAAQFADWLKGLDAPLQIVEAGAHDGRLAADVLTWFQQERPELFERIDYWLMEPSLVRHSAQEKTLGGYAAKVRWFNE